MRGERLEIKNCENLKHCLENERRNDVKLKLLFINSLLLNENDLEIACQLFHIALRTGYDWISKWNANGVDGLIDKPISGRKARLNNEKLATLKNKLLEKDHWDISEIQHVVKNLFNVELSNKRLAVILREMNMNYAKPYKLDYRRPDNAEEILIKTISDLSKKLDEEGIDKNDVVIGFMDEASPQNKANSGRFWTFTSAKMKENTSKYKSNTIAFYSLNGNDAIMFLEDSKEEGIADFLREIRNQNPDPEVIIVILDNFKSHKTELCQSVALENGIYLVFIPPYSPDLNPIEFIWKSIRRTISKFFIESQEHLRDIIVTAFSWYSETTSFASSWIEKIASKFDFLKFLKSEVN